jgi:uncharacterized membrane protein YphA (DoxX/SURF4 family)
LGARLILGVVLLVAGISKVTNLAASVHATNAYEILPFPLVKIVGNGLPFIEIGVGFMLIIGFFTRAMGLIGALLMLAFVIAIASVWVRGIAIDCGCFGDGGSIDHDKAMAAYPWEIARDLGLMACGIWLALRRTYFLAVDSWLFRPVEEILARQDTHRRR